MHPDAQTEIERLQPYHRGEAFEQDPLWRLQALNVFDKHRTLHVLAINSVAFQLSFDLMENVSALAFDAPDAVTTLPGPVEGATKVNRWRIPEATPIRPNQKVRVKFPPALAVLFDEATPVVGGEQVLSTLAAIDQHILSNVLPPLVPFLK